MWRDAREWFAGKVAELGLRVETDSAGNNWVTLPGASPKTVIVGSHLDSVPNGGWLDGCLGVMAGARGAADARGDARRRSRCRLVDWADEEGARFGRSLLGSAAAAGSLKIDDVRELKDRQGTRLVDALAENGVALDRMLDAHRELKAIDARAYLELHIEQGPVLESMKKPTGVVLGTFGVERHMLRFTGQAAHSGSTPIPMRRDAFLAAAQTALECREIAHAPFEAGAGAASSAPSASSTSSRRSSPRCRASARSRSISARSTPASSRRCCATRTAASERGGAREPRHASSGAAVADQSAPVRSGAGAAVRGGGARGNRRRAAAAVGPAARRRGDGAAHAGRDDVRVFVERPVALQGRGHAEPHLEKTIRAYLRLVEKTVAHVASGRVETPSVLGFETGRII